MKSVLASVASVALFAGSVVAQAPMVNTPASSTVCQPLLITWSGGTPPYFLSILPGNQPSAAPLIDFGQVSGTQLTWTVNVTNSELGINLRDSSGLLSQSAAFPNLPGTNQACLTQAPSPPAGPTSSGSGSAPAPGSTTPPAPPTSVRPTSAPPATTAVPTNPTSKPATSAAPTNTAPTGSPSPSTTGAASSLSAKAGIAGALGMAIAALFV